MAARRCPIGGATALLVVVVVASACSWAAASAGAGSGVVEPVGGIRRRLREGAGRKVGGRTDVRDVEGDREVQELGRFSVEEYNRYRQECCGDGVRLEFGRVVAAQRQVVSGLKYYLRVAATEEGAENGGNPRVFDAIVVIKPWLESRTLVRFAPAAPQRPRTSRSTSRS
ncbi:hypothetical protein GUJ93_ZPchr0001g31250 [Zizania palustris]|uniref:Cystatin domain-containing protein n=1 Tax=Zizania palustris TaxID=103762 RepID=A0A8J5VNN6_ZIZPA|nr:hypothetical protein GUJ93_ZPchr0001g31250 [Zizania palustris]